MTAASEHTYRRGRPIIVMAALLAVYGLARTTFWEGPLDLATGLAHGLPTEEVDRGQVEKRVSSFFSAPASEAFKSTANGLFEPVIGIAQSSRLASRIRSANTGVIASLGPPPLPGIIPSFEADAPRSGPPTLSLSRAASDEQVSLLAPITNRPDRWSFYGYAYLRSRGGDRTTGGVLPSSYGGSQAGAVVRYKFAPQSATNPSVYVRATRDLGGSSELPAASEAALGVSGRPVASIPVSAHFELRARNAGGNTDLRPSAFAVTELAPLDLPLGTRGEMYAQTGYVGGEFATGFIDGQARVVRDVASFPKGKLSAGAGVWGGAQKGANRLDIGPSVSADFRIGPVSGRAQLDYRMRVAGDAVPGDGLAVTLSTGL